MLLKPIHRETHVYMHEIYDHANHICTYVESDEHTDFHDKQNV